MGVDVIVGGHPHVVEPVDLLESTVAGLDADARHEADSVLHVANAAQLQAGSVEVAH